MAADVAPLWTKAPVKAVESGWTGFYLSSHFSYATGYSRWSATEAGAAVPSVAGSLDFFHAYDGFKGTGSYQVGLQAGYNYVLPSRLLLGVEADVSFPNFLGGTQVISSALIGQATYTELTQLSGTVRGRIGYATGNWLVYATAGLAWTYNQFVRTQIAPFRHMSGPVAGAALFILPGCLAGGSPDL